MGEPTFTLRSGASWQDPYPMYAALRDHDPVYHVASGDYWVLTRFDDAFAAARDHGRFSSAQGLTVTWGEREAIGLDAAAPLVMLDPPEHTAFRRLVSRAMTPRRVAHIEALVRTFVRDRLDTWDTCDEVDIVATLATPLANMVVAHFLGVPEADREQFGVWTEAIVAANATGDVLAAGERLGELLTYFADLVELRRREPGADLLSMLVEASRDGEPVPDAQILGFAFTMVAGGNDTVSGMVAGSTHLLGAHPDQRAIVATAPTVEAGVVEELLRLVSPVQGLARTTTTDVTIRDTVIPAHRKVLIAYGAANRDPREFGDDAEALRVDRVVPRTLAFGSGAHHCLGAAAARLEVRTALTEVLRTYPDYVVDADRGTYAEGNYVRRFATLPVQPGSRRTTARV